MKINWTVRLKNKAFWAAFIPALLLLVQVIAEAFGVSLEPGAIGGRLLAIVDAVFALLAILGVVTDPTTAGLGDSERAMHYEKPQ